MSNTIEGAKRSLDLFNDVLEEWGQGRPAYLIGRTIQWEIGTIKSPAGLEFDDILMYIELFPWHRVSVEQNPDALMLHPHYDCDGMLCLDEAAMSTAKNDLVSGLVDDDKDLVKRGLVRIYQVLQTSNHHAQGFYSCLTPGCLIPVHRRDRLCDKCAVNEVEV